MLVDVIPHLTTLKAELTSNSRTAYRRLSTLLTEKNSNKYATLITLDIYLLFSIRFVLSIYFASEVYCEVGKLSNGDFCSILCLEGVCVCCYNEIGCIPRV